ncbi:MAG: sialate O-acetylesterase [bacterium]|nr:sialate O-acetylesterase [bacterium]
MKRITPLLMALCLAVTAYGEVQTPAIFSSHMVLQRGKEIPVWGTAAPGEAITVTLAGTAKSTQADTDGKWIVRLPAMTEGGPYLLRVMGQNSLVFEDVLIGEVWLCSGQSNMEMPLQGWPNQPIEGSDEAIQAANYPNLRLFTVKKRIAPQPEYDCEGEWSACTPEKAAPFSATAFFFGRKVYQELNIPVGLIHSSWGGTPAEAWTSGESLSRLEDFKAEVERIRQAENPTNPQAPTVLYNGMIQPLVPFALRGAIWYQGESNASRAKQYRTVFPNMIQNWRDVFQQGDFPFYFDQIAPFNYGVDNTIGVELREVQRECLATVKNIGMAVLLDKTTMDNIHPPYKKEAGERMALWALAKDYGKDVVYSGPIYKSQTIEDGQIRLNFDYAAPGLQLDNVQADDFKIAGEDKVFHPAEVKIDGETLVVSSPQVPKPVAVQYAWSNFATASLFNKAGLPASSFRTDEW